MGLVATGTVVVEILLVDDLDHGVCGGSLHWIPIVRELVANGVDSVDEGQITAIA